MCFSAAASFTAAAGLGVIGAATLKLGPPLRSLPFALTPLLFAVHQLIEGFVWLAVDDGAGVPQALTNSWVFIAKSFWPVWTPFMVLLMEPDRKRRRGLIALLIAGAVVSAVLFSAQLSNPYSVRIIGHSLQYETAHPFGESLVGLYLLATVAPLLISRFRFVEYFGIAVLVGSVTTQIAFAHAGASVWCFFAAISSALVYLHVREQSVRPAFSSPMPGL
jgi:hypothetical protein